VTAAQAGAAASRYQQNIGSARSMKEPHLGNLIHIHPIDNRALLWPRFRDSAFINIINRIAIGEQI
jgi:hypothetical protein